MTGWQGTPGPWAITKWKNDDAVAVDPSSSTLNRGCAVARCFGSDAEANAVGIAALPEMVAALLYISKRAAQHPEDTPEDDRRDKRHVLARALTALKTAGMKL